MKSIRTVSAVVFLVPLGGAAMGIFSPARATAAIHYVPQHHASISSAINSASDGDTILVGPGTYREFINVDGKYIYIKATDPNPNNTIIASDPWRSPVMFQHVPYRSGTQQAGLEGFKITNGYSPDGQGGAITIANSADPIITDNVIANNQSTVHGGGILVYNNSNPTIKDNVIQDNFATTFGGGIFVVMNSSPIIIGNTISNNIVSGAVIPNGGAAGGGIYLENNVATPSAKSAPMVINNTINNNSAAFAGGGIMLRVGVNAIVENNTINGNASAYGGGIHVETEGSSPKIIGNQINGNSAIANPSYAGSGHGGGISVYNTSYPKVSSNTITGNSASIGGGGIVLAESSNSQISANTIADNQVTNTTSTYSGGGIYIAFATAYVANNLIDNNSASLGGGVSAMDGAQLTLTNNTLVKNSATWGGTPAAGGALFVRNHAGLSATVSNNIFAENQDFQIFEEFKKANFTNNLIADDSDGIYYNYNTGPIHSIATFNSSAQTEATNNVSGSPMFINSGAEDYQLQSGSPAIDTAIVPYPTSDILGSTRDSGVSADAGSYERVTAIITKYPVYRFWSAEAKSHFYTTSLVERNNIIANYPGKTWSYESGAFDSIGALAPGAVAVYRFWSPENKGHFYTIDEAEKDYVIANYPPSVWQYEGVGFYVLDLSSTGLNLTVYRFWSPLYKHHFYTASEAEKDYLINTPSLALIWQYEGPRFKVPASNN